MVVGGELSAAGDVLLAPLVDSLDRYAIPTAAADVDVVAGELGKRAEVMGALALVLSEPAHAASRHDCGAGSGCMSAPTRDCSKSNPEEGEQ